MGRNPTGPPCSVGRPNDHAAGPPVRRQRYRRRRRQTLASKTIQAHSLGGPVITWMKISHNAMCVEQRRHDAFDLLVIISSDYKVLFGRIHSCPNTLTASSSKHNGAAPDAASIHSMSSITSTGILVLYRFAGLRTNWQSTVI